MPLWGSIARAAAWLWDAAARVFVSADDDKPLSPAEVRQSLDLVLDAGAQRIRDLSQELAVGDISLDAWRDAVQAELKSLHLAATLAAVGGIEQATPEVLAGVEDRLGVQFGYLDRFADQLESGAADPEAAATAQRAASYADAARIESYEDVKRQAEIDAGTTWARRILDPDAEHCDGCLDEAGRGWVPIDDLLPLGDAECGPRCRCEIEYATADETENNPDDEGNFNMSEPNQFALEGAGRVGDYWLKAGKIFDFAPRSGKIQMTAKEFLAANPRPTPIAFDVEHRPSLFSGKIGSLIDWELRGEEVWGRGLFPDALESLVPGPKPVSLHFDPETFQIVGCGLVLNPAIEDAALFAATAAFSKLTQKQRDDLPDSDFGDPSGRKYPILDQDDVDSAARLIGKADNPEAVKKRILAICKRKNLKPPDAWVNEGKHSFADTSADPAPPEGRTMHGQTVLQAIHDHTAASGAVCDPDNSGPKPYFHTTAELNSIQKIHDLATKGGAACAVRTGTQSPAYSADPQFAAAQKRIAALEAELAANRKLKIEADAAAFAAASAVTPVSRPILQALYIQAATDDHRHAGSRVTFSGADGKTAVVSRVDALRAYVAALPRTILDGHFARNPPPVGTQVLDPGPDGSDQVGPMVFQAVNRALAGRYPQADNHK